MLRTVIWILVFALIIVGLGEYDKKYPHLKYNALSDRILHPLDTRVRYRIGNIDPKFGLSQNDVKQLSQEATDIWHKGTGKEWFVYDENARLTVNLIYDERQANTLAKQQMENKIDEKIKSQNNKEQSLQDEKVQLESEWQTLQNQIEMFNAKSELAQLQHDYATLQTLNGERAILEKKLNAYKAKEYAFNQKINQYNQTQTQINFDIKTAQQKFPPREFHKGVFNGLEINIYEYKSIDDLRLTLAHEFGHALDIEHHSEPKGLMYTHAGEQDAKNFKLHSSDLALLREKHK